MKRRGLSPYTEEIVSNLHRHRANLVAYEQRAQDLFARGEDEELLLVVETGASFAWDQHPGCFASETFENILQQVGMRHCLNTHPQEKSRIRPRVLHVMTEGYDTGGHTKIPVRWAKLDTKRDHYLVLTNQQVPLPTALADAFGDRLITLKAQSRVGKVEELSALLVNYDAVVLNIHPNDSVSVAACAGSMKRPLTLHLNTADHTFWIGLLASDWNVNLRPSAKRFNHKRRERGRHATVLLPLPLEEVAVEQGSLRERLQIPPTALVTLSCADPYKSAGIGETTFIHALKRLFDAIPTLHHIAVGPDATTSGWKEAAAKYDRLHLFGTTTKYKEAYAAADIFLDTWPFSGITAALEAALFSLPVLSFGGASSSPLQLDDLGLQPLRAKSIDQWIAQIKQWGENPSLAKAVGKEMSQATRDAHFSTAWKENVEALYRLPRSRKNSVKVPRRRPFDEIDIEVEKLGNARRAVSTARNS